MAITMQGSWYVRVKAKNASFAQRFVISGAASGNGTFTGVVGNTVHVTGNSWTITIENNPGTGFRPSRERLLSPHLIGSMFHFDIQSDDGGGQDTDFNDLVLDCFTPNDGTTFLLYGNASYYDDNCMVNPCRRRVIVLESAIALREALQIKPLYDAIRKYYPERIHIGPKNPGDPGPVEFTPLYIPLDDEAAIPAQKLVKAEFAPVEIEMSSESKKAETVNVNAVRSFEITPLASNVAAAKYRSDILVDKISISSIVDRLRFCDHGSLPFSILRFFEYDRTNAELAGNPYTGLGNHETLGNCVTDENGNYIFRFNRNIYDFLGELGDIAPGEIASQQVLPDIIAGLVDTTNPLNLTYESAPYWNVPYLYRLNICIPKSRIGHQPFNCEGQSVIQRIGDIMVPLHAGIRGTVYNSLDASGIITAHDPNSVNVNCAAWAGRLEMWGCLNDPQIKFYTVEYNNGGGWQFVTEDTSLPRMVWNSVTLQYDYPNVSVNTVQNLRIHGNGNPAVLTHCFLNAEVDPPTPPHNDQWMITKRNLKAYLSSSLYASPYGSVWFRITGYASSGNQLPVQESITLYLDNNGAEFAVDPSITMNGVTSNNCSLFCLQGAAANTPLTIRFKAVQKTGFMSNYNVYMYKGAANPFGIAPGVTNAVFSGSFLNNVLNTGRAYVHTTPCDQKFTGTDKEVTADVNGYYQVDITPAGGANWLEGDETFCAFTIQLQGNIRHTDGKTGYPYYNTAPIAIGIQKNC